MGTVIWEGGSTAIAQVDTITIALTWATNDTVTLTIGTRSIVLTVGTDATTANVATAIKEMWNGDAQTGSGDHTFSPNGDTITEFNEITATVNSSVVTLTSDTTGVPFTVEVTGDGTAGNGTAVVAASTANAGPNTWDTATNWDTGAIPVDADDVVIENSSLSILYGIDQAAVSLATLTIKSTFTGTIGLPRNNPAGYVEYRPTYLDSGASGDAQTTTINIGQGTGTGSGRIKFDANDSKVIINLYKTGTRTETGIPAFLFKGTHTDNEINVNRGDMGIAFFGGETANFEIMRVGYTTSIAGDSIVLISTGVTHNGSGTISQTGGRLESRSTLAGTLECFAGLFILSDDVNVNDVTLDGGTFVANSSGKIDGTLTARSGVLDCSKDSRAFTIDAANIQDNVSILKASRITWTATPTFVNTNLTTS